MKAGAQLLFALSLFTACRKRYKEQAGLSVRQQNSPPGLTFVSTGRSS